MALPFSDGWVAIPINTGVFFILAVLGLEVFGVILGGYASASKWSLFGSMREAAQVVSYEVPLGMCVVVTVSSPAQWTSCKLARCSKVGLRTG